MEKKGSSRTIDASPTKDLFIHMLVKDIPLSRAIIDLVDNSVDGARRIKPQGNYKGLWIRIEISESQFRIVDNCGGIPTSIAEKYAFRFGRSDENPITTRSVGQFGVGMKRAFFKLGKIFRVQSTTKDSQFIVEENIDEWILKDKWEFEFKSITENSHFETDEIGTKIVIRDLHPNVMNSFKLVNWQTSLIQEIMGAHLLTLKKGITISLNGIPIQHQPLKLLHSDKIKPACFETSFYENNPPEVKVKIFTGIADSDPSRAGWYVFCNGRMVLEANQTSLTGWGEGGETTFPRYHNQYSRFRGYVFFESDNAGKLPWNTTKTGVDSDSEIYQFIRLQMIQLGRPVITFLNKVKEEKESAASSGSNDDTPLENEIKKATLTSYSEVSINKRFIYPSSQSQRKLPNTTRIKYDKAIEEVDIVKRLLKVKTNKEVGEKTFEYYLQMEGDQ